MDSLVLAPTKSSLAVRFDPSTGLLELEGQSYPENSHAFFAPLIEWVERFLVETAVPARLVLRLSYLNTSSTKFILDLFDILEQHHTTGRDIRVTWCYAADDEDILQTGEDFKADLQLPFELVAVV